MKKIEISDKMKEYHKNYFESKILPVLESIYKVQTGDFKKMVKYLMDSWETLATGDLACLSNIQDYLEKNHALLLDKDDKMNLLLQAFGYDRFSNTPIYTFLREQAISEDSTLIKNYYRLGLKIIEKAKMEFPEYKTEFDSIEKKYPTMKKKADYIKSQIEKVIVKDFDFTTENYKYFAFLNKNWSAYSFVLMGGWKVCPYCGRQLITPIFSTSGKTRAQLDHFLPKSKYPYFSMSIYNLVPSCYSCNASLKHTKEFSFSSLYPYRDDINEFFRFSIDMLNLYHIKVVPLKDPDRVEEYINMFKLETQYNYHTDIAKSLIKTRNRFSEAQIKDLYEKNKNIFFSEEDLRRRLVGQILDREDLKQQPLAKFKNDLIKELKLL